LLLRPPDEDIDNTWPHLTMKKFLGLRGNALNWAIGTIAGIDFLLFGYGTDTKDTNPCYRC
jgi:hypothetical protein